MEGSEWRTDVKSRNGEKPVWTLESKGESGMKWRVKRPTPHWVCAMLTMLSFTESSGLPLKMLRLCMREGGTR